MMQYLSSVVGAIVYLLIIGLLGFAGFLIADYIIKFLDYLGTKIAEIIANRISSPYLVLTVETLFILTNVSSIFLYQQDLDLLSQSLILPLILTFITFEGIIMNKLKLKYAMSPSIFGWVKSKAKAHPYIKSRIILLFCQIPGILIILTSFWVILNMMFTFHWPRPFYYVIFLVLPIFLTLWIYVTYPIQFQTNADTINARKFLVYSYLAWLAISDYYSKFRVQFLDGGRTIDDPLNLFFIMITVVFIAFDRIFKLWSDDIKTYQTNSKSITPIKKPPIKKRRINSPTYCVFRRY